MFKKSIFFLIGILFLIPISASAGEVKYSFYPHYASGLYYETPDEAGRAVFDYNKGSDHYTYLGVEKVTDIAYQTIAQYENPLAPVQYFKPIIYPYCFRNNVAYVISNAEELTQCISDKCKDKTGQKAASGYIDLGSAGSGGSPETTVCHDGCAAGFSQESTNSTVLMLGVKHYFAHGSYIYNGNACTPGAPLPPVLAALPGDTCAPGEVLSEKTGEPVCIPENGGGGGTGGGGGNGGGSQAVITFYHNDPSGSPIVATDESGNLLWKENYRPYGGKLNTSTHSEDNPIGFHGKPFDDHTGLSYMGARYYHPVLGRFTGVDPIGFLEENIHSHNRYAYANNNPYRYVDPDGLAGITIATNTGTVISFQNMPSSSALDTIKQLPDGSIMSLDLIGHGSSELIEFGNDAAMIVLDSGTIGIDGVDITDILRNKMMNQSEITLFGCHTAQGNDNIALRLSKSLPGSFVSGNRKYVLSTHQFAGFYIGGNGRITFSNKTYKNGAVVK